jgi:replicative DNA helicase
MDKQNRVGSILKAVIERYDRKNGKLKRPLKTGIAALDNALGGLRNGQIIVIGGRPSIGKTALALNIAINTAITQKTNVLYFSLALDRDLLARRIWEIVSNIDFCLLRKKLRSNKEWEQISKGLKALALLPLYIYDKPCLSTRDISYYMNKAALEGELGLVVIDYVQLQPDMTGASKIKDNMASLKYYAEKLDVPIIITSQLNRSVDWRKYPQHFRLSDFRGGRNIGKMADVLIFIYREAYYKGPEIKNPDKMNLLVINKDAGTRSSVNVSFNKNTSKISQYPARTPIS